MFVNIWEKSNPVKLEKFPSFNISNCSKKEIGKDPEIVYFVDIQILKSSKNTKT